MWISKLNLLLLILGFVFVSFLLFCTHKSMIYCGHVSCKKKINENAVLSYILGKPLRIFDLIWIYQCKYIFQTHSTLYLFIIFCKSFYHNLKRQCFKMVLSRKGETSKLCNIPCAWHIRYTKSVKLCFS